VASALLQRAWTACCEVRNYRFKLTITAQPGTVEENRLHFTIAIRHQSKFLVESCDQIVHSCSLNSVLRHVGLVHREDPPQFSWVAIFPEHWESERWHQNVSLSSGLRKYFAASLRFFCHYFFIFSAFEIQLKGKWLCFWAFS